MATPAPNAIRRASLPRSHKTSIPPSVVENRVASDRAKASILVPTGRAEPEKIENVSRQQESARLLNVVANASVGAHLDLLDMAAARADDVVVMPW